MNKLRYFIFIIIFCCITNTVTVFADSDNDGLDDQINEADNSLIIEMNGAYPRGRLNQPIYGHVFKTTDKEGQEYIELQYWIYYSQNPLGYPDVEVNILGYHKTIYPSHEGDWEYIAIRLDPEKWKPQQIF